MRSVFSRQLHWVALGVGILILVAGIFVAVSPFQDDSSAGPVLSAGEDRLDELEGGGALPGMPARISVGDGEFEYISGVSSGTSETDSSELDASTAEPPTPHGGPGDVASVQDTANLVVRDAKGNIKQHETVR